MYIFLSVFNLYTLKMKKKNHEKSSNISREYFRIHLESLTDYILQVRSSLNLLEDGQWNKLLDSFCRGDNITILEVLFDQRFQSRIV